MTIREQVSLLPFNTFKIDVNAAYFIEINTQKELIELCQSGFLADKNHLVLGSGSNILFTKDYAGVIIKNQLKKIEFKESGNVIRVTAGAGEIWHQLVLTTLEKGAYGLENLSLIPGTVGAAPVQNIGAYGLELKDVFEQLQAIEIATGKVVHFNRAQCGFKYRQSAFKQELKGRYIITEVTLDLHKKPDIKINYAPLKKELETYGISQPSPHDVSRAVINVRQSKLPDPAKIGNAGSFFKNPVISLKDYRNLKLKYNGLPAFPQPNAKVKVPAAWLIEQAGWKGKTIDNVGVNPLQPLVLVNYGGGTGKEVKALAQQIIDSVYKMFKIQLEPEVNIF